MRLTQLAITQLALRLGLWEVLKNLPFRKLADYDNCPAAVTTPYRAWSVTCKLLGQPSPPRSPFLPLWKNSHLPHLRNLQDFHYWPQLGIKLLGYLLTDCNFPTFVQLRTKCKEHPIQYFHYLQLWHAFQVHFLLFTVNCVSGYPTFIKPSMIQSLPPLPKAK